MTEDGTFATEIVDNLGRHWILGKNGETAIHIDNGGASLFCWSGLKLYAQGVGDNTRWYVLNSSNRWDFFGENPPIPFPEPLALPRLRVRGHCFEKETGERFTAIETTDYRLYQMFLNGENIVPILQQREEEEFNLVRVLGMCHNMFRLYPTDYSDFYSSIVPFFQLCTAHHLYVEFTAFADATIVMPNLDQQIGNWINIGQEVQKVTNKLIELVNEEDQPVNRLACRDMVSKFPNVLCSRGSNGSERPPIRDAFSAPLKAGASGWWDYETAHWNDAFEWWRKVGHNAMEYNTGARYTDGPYNGQIAIPASGVPVLSNENTRLDKDRNLAHFEDAPTGASLLCAGSCCHTDDGKFSRLFSEDTLTFTRAWVKGAKKVDLNYQDGDYFRLDPGTFLRRYERRLDNSSFVAEIRK